MPYVHSVNARAEDSVDQTIVRALGGRIRKRREALGLSQKELGERLRNENGNRVEGSMISKWERGDNLPRRRLYWGQLAEALEVKPDWLFGELFTEEGELLINHRVARLEEEVAVLRGLLRFSDSAMEDAIQSTAIGGTLRGGLTESSEDPVAQDAREVERAADVAFRESETDGRRGHDTRRPKGKRRRAG